MFIKLAAEPLASRSFIKLIGKAKIQLKLNSPKPSSGLRESSKKGSSYQNLDVDKKTYYDNEIA